MCACVDGDKDKNSREGEGEREKDGNTDRGGRESVHTDIERYRKNRGGEKERACWVRIISAP